MKTFGNIQRSSDSSLQPKRFLGWHLSFESQCCICWTEFWSTHKGDSPLMKQEELEIGDDASGTIGALKPYSPLRIRSDYQPSVNIPPQKKRWWFCVVFVLGWIFLKRGVKWKTSWPMFATWRCTSKVQAGDGPFFFGGGVGEVDGWRTNQLTNQPTPPNVPPVWNKSLIRPYKRKPMVNEPLIKPGFISWALGGYVWGLAGWPVTGLGKFGEISGIRSMCLLDSFSRSMRVPHKLPVSKCCVHSEPCQIDDDMELPYIPFRKMLGSKRILMTNLFHPCLKGVPIATNISPTVTRKWFHISWTFTSFILVVLGVCFLNFVCITNNETVKWFARLPEKMLLVFRGPGIHSHQRVLPMARNDEMWWGLWHAWLGFMNLVDTKRIWRIYPPGSLSVRPWKVT